MPDLIASRDYLRICIPVYLIKVALARPQELSVSGQAEGSEPMEWIFSM